MIFFWLCWLCDFDRIPQAVFFVIIKLPRWYLFPNWIYFTLTGSHQYKTCRMEMSLGRIKVAYNSWPQTSMAMLAACAKCQQLQWHNMRRKNQGGGGGGNGLSGPIQPTNHKHKWRAFFQNATCFQKYLTMFSFSSSVGVVESVNVWIFHGDIQ